VFGLLLNNGTSRLTPALRIGGCTVLHLDDLRRTPATCRDVPVHASSTKCVATLTTALCLRAVAAFYSLRLFTPCTLFAQVYACVARCAPPTSLTPRTPIVRCLRASVSFSRHSFCHAVCFITPFFSLPSPSSEYSFKVARLVMSCCFVVRSSG